MPNSIKEIQDNTFYNCKDLLTVNLPNSIIEIKANAFYGCTSLSSLSLPYTLNSIGKGAFQYCKSLSSITIPKGVTEIKDNTFRGCVNLSSVELPSTLSSIGSGAFWESAVSTITIPNGVTYIGSSAFCWCIYLKSITIPNSVTTLGDCAFLHCIRLENVMLSNNLTELNEGVFMGCENLTSIDLPLGMTTIENQALRGSGLKTLTFPYSLRILGEGAFKDCVNLTSIDFRYSVETIGKEAFMACTSLKTLTLPITVISVGEGSFSDCTALTDVNLSYETKKVSDYMFYNCISLQNVNIHNNITEIGSYAFYGCGLTDIILSDNVAIIGANAFDNSSLESISVSPHNNYFSTEDNVLFNKAQTLIVYVPNNINNDVAIPRSVTTIRSDDFKNRSLLNSITIPKEIISIGDSAFLDCKSLTVYVETYILSPSGWSSSWNTSNRPVIWGCSLDENGYVASIYKTASSISNPNASGGIKAPYLDGFEFAGWSITQNGVVTYTATTVNSAPNNTTLYAIWIDLFAGNYEFKVINSGSSYEIKVKDGITLTGNIIPASYRGLPVTKIADDGFSDNAYANAYARTNEITSITLPDTIVEIGNYAFSNCQAATIINISEYSLLKK